MSTHTRKLLNCTDKKIIFGWMTSRLLTDDTVTYMQSANKWKEREREWKYQCVLCVCMCISLKFIKLEHLFFTVDGDWSAVEIALSFFHYRLRFFFFWVAYNRMIHSVVSHFISFDIIIIIGFSSVVGSSVAQIVEIGFCVEEKNRMLQIMIYVCIWWCT